MELLALTDIDLVDVILKIEFFEHDGDVTSVRRSPSIKIDHPALLGYGFLPSLHGSL